MTHTVENTETPHDGWGIGHAHGKAILIGEHSVVHGAPAIAVPLYDLGVEATLDAAEPGFLDTDIYTGLLSEAPQRLGPPIAALHHATDHFGLDLRDLRLRLRSTIPYERGLGSSAAVATAIARASASFATQNLGKLELFELVQAAERVAHGTPSGLDAHTVSATSAVRFQQGYTTPLEVSHPFTLVVADTGMPGRTSIAVAHVREQLTANPKRVWPLIGELSELTETVQDALRDGRTNELGTAMNQAHTVLSQLEVSAPELDHLVAAARAADAVGAKLTGGGMGGCVIALARTPEHAQDVAAALRDAGAARAWSSSLASVTTGSIAIQEVP
jgi:mevalonate kinase